MSVEVRVLERTDAFVRGYVEVVAGFHTPDGFMVERVEPRLTVEDGEPKVDGWQATQRLLPRGELVRHDDDPVAFRLHRTQVRAAGLALLAYADGDGGGPPGDATALRKDLERERARADRLEAALLEVTARLTPTVRGEHRLVPGKPQP